jgi:hypothetical protein
VTLRDAGAYITDLPLKVHSAPAWETAMHILIQAADHGGPIAFAHLAMMQALFPKGEPVYTPVSKEPVWRNGRRLARER